MSLERGRDGDARGLGGRALYVVLGLGLSSAVACAGMCAETPPATSGTAPDERAPATAATAPTPTPEVEPERLRVRVQARHPHDRDAFTQGLVYDHGRIFESTGLPGRSSLREVRLEDGEVLRRRVIDAPRFAEGLALVGGELVQLTWQDHVAFVYDAATFETRRQHRYATEGWGLCFDGTSLVMSDGSDTLFFRDPATFEVRREVTVRRRGRPVRQLNELECVGPHVYANVWQTDEIVRVVAESGAVDREIDASGLLSEEERYGADVLNGIAYVPETQRFLITGKLWPVLFEVTFEAVP